MERALRTNTVLQFGAVCAVPCLYASTTEMRIFYMLLGLVVSLVYYPKCLFEYQEDSYLLGAMLTLREIWKRGKLPHISEWPGARRSLASVTVPDTVRQAP